MKTEASSPGDSLDPLAASRRRPSPAAHVLRIPACWRRRCEYLAPLNLLRARLHLCRRRFRGLGRLGRRLLRLVFRGPCRRLVRRGGGRSRRGRGRGRGRSCNFLWLRKARGSLADGVARWGSRRSLRRGIKWIVFRNLSGRRRSDLAASMTAKYSQALSPRGTYRRIFEWIAARLGKWVLGPVAHFIIVQLIKARAARL